MSNIRKYLIQLVNQYLWFAGFIFLFSLGQLQRIQVTSSIAIYAHEIFALTWVLKELKSYFSWLKCKVKNDFLQKNSHLIYFLIFIFLQLFLYNIVNFQVTQVTYYLRFAFYTVFLLFLVFQRQINTLSSKSFKLATAFIGVFVAIMGTLQYLIIPDSRFLIYSGWDDHYYRLVSTLFDPGFTALMLVIIFLSLISWQKKLTVFFSFFITPLFLFTILLTYSRAGYLSLVFGLLTAMALQFAKIKEGNGKSKSIFMTSILFIFFISIPLLPKPGGEGVNLLRTASIHQRLESNQKAIDQLNWQTFFLGTGFYRNITTNPDLPNHATAPDNSFIFIFSSLGIVGTGFLLNFLFSVKQKIISNQTMQIVFVALLTNSIFNNSLFYAWNWILVGLIAISELLNSTKWKTKKVLTKV